MIYYTPKKITFNFIYIQRKPNCFIGQACTIKYLNKIAVGFVCGITEKYVAIEHYIDLTNIDNTQIASQILISYLSKPYTISISPSLLGSELNCYGNNLEKDYKLLPRHSIKLKTQQYKTIHQIDNQIQTDQKKVENTIEVEKGRRSIVLVPKLVFFDFIENIFKTTDHISIVVLMYENLKQKDSINNILKKTGQKSQSLIIQSNNSKENTIAINTAFTIANYFTKQIKHDCDIILFESGSYKSAFEKSEQNKQEVINNYKPKDWLDSIQVDFTDRDTEKTVRIITNKT